jgi:hypothetical protein
MASSIISTTIDETFPVAGTDNDSQGFRDNFAIIKDNFAYAKTEIETLQTDTAKTNVDNAFANNTLSVLNLEKHTETAYGPTNISASTADISFNSGHHFVITAQNDITFTFKDWPLFDQYAEMRIQVYGDGSSLRTITFAGEWASAATSQIHTDGNAAWTGADITTSVVTTRSHLVKAFTYDQGANVFLQYLGTFNEVV